MQMYAHAHIGSHEHTETYMHIQVYNYAIQDMEYIFLKSF